MRAKYDFSKGKRGPVVDVPRGKTRITIRQDGEVVRWFREQVNAAGGGNYQNLVNAALHEHITAETLEKTLMKSVTAAIPKQTAPRNGSRKRAL